LADHFGMAVQDSDWFRRARDDPERPARGAQAADTIPYAGEPPFRGLGLGEAPEPRKGLSGMHPLVFVFALVCGVMLAWFLEAGYMHMKKERALAAALVSATTAAREEEERAEEARLAALAEQSRRAEAQRAAEEAHLREVRQRQEAEDAARGAAQEEEQARAAAWAKFYRPSASCRDSVSVECANAYIRAKRAFEAQYKP